MTHELHASKWQEIGWNGLVFQVPASWQPTVIYPAYLFFEQEGAPAFEIKWQHIRGRFSTDKALDKFRGSLKKDANPERWDLPPHLQQLVSSFRAAGWQLQQDNTSSQGLILFCPACKRATLLQWHFDADRDNDSLARILGSLKDHNEAGEQLWAIYDIRAWLPGDATLRSHEFMPGRYTLCFDHKDTTLTLYRFKPAAVLLEKKSVEEFGKQFMDVPPLDKGNGWATWQQKAEGLDVILAKLRRKPVWQWMQLRHDPDQNVILGVRAEGKHLMETDWLERICNNYKSIQSH